MRILIYSAKFAPEPTGIGKYSGEMAAWLVAEGHAASLAEAERLERDREGPDGTIAKLAQAGRFLDVAEIGLAAVVDAKMRLVAAQGKTVDSLRVAVLAALNIADELAAAEQRLSELNGSISETQSSIRNRASSLNGLLDSLLDEDRRVADAEFALGGVPVQEVDDGSTDVDHAFRSTLIRLAHSQHVGGVDGSEVANIASEGRAGQSGVHRGQVVRVFFSRVKQVKSWQRNSETGPS